MGVQRSANIVKMDGQPFSNYQQKGKNFFRIFLRNGKINFFAFMWSETYLRPAGENKIDNSAFV